MRNCSKWIFDLDGTLTEDQHDFDLIRSRLGVPPGRLILEYSETLPKEESKVLLDKLAILERDVIRKTQVANGAKPLLHLLRSRSHFLGILTRNTRKNAIKTLKKIGLKEFFPDELIVGREEKIPKPDPEGIFYLLHKWKTDSKNCAIVGDYCLDLEAGRRAGIITILVDTSKEERWENLSDFRVGSLLEMKSLLEKR